MILLQANVNSKSFSMLVLVEAVDIHLQQKLYQLRVLPIDILSVQWLVHNPLPKFSFQTCYQNKALVFEHILNVFLTNVFSLGVGVGGLGECDTCPTCSLCLLVIGAETILL